jgi:hypothetical protein
MGTYVFPRLAGPLHWQSWLHLYSFAAGRKISASMYFPDDVRGDVGLAGHEGRGGEHEQDVVEGQG